MTKSLFYTLIVAGALLIRKYFVIITIDKGRVLLFCTMLILRVISSQHLIVSRKKLYSTQYCKRTSRLCFGTC